MKHLNQHTLIGILTTLGLALCSQPAICQDVSPPSPAPEVEAFDLTEVEQIVGYEGLDRWYRRYRKQTGQYRHFGEYVLENSFRKYKSGRRQLVLGSVLLVMGGAAISVGATVANNDSDEESYEDDEDDYSEWEGMGDALLGVTMILVGMQAVVGGTILAVMGGYKMRKYGRWRDRLLDAAAGNHRSFRPQWEGVGLQVGSDRFFVGTGVRF